MHNIKPNTNKMQKKLYKLINFVIYLFILIYYTNNTI